MSGQSSALATLEVVHRVRGRMRVAVTPAKAAVLARLVEVASKIAGVQSAAVGASGRNVVVLYDWRHADEQTLLTRLALALSAQVGYQSVRVLSERLKPALDRSSLWAGFASGGATVVRSLMPNTLLSGVVGWSAALLTLSTVGRKLAAALARGEIRPEGLSVIHLLSRLQGDDRANGALLTWLLVNGDGLAELIRGRRRRGVELTPVALRDAIGDDQSGRHMEIMTRPVLGAGFADGRILTPSTLVSTAVGMLVYALRQRG
jgi:hypothetical protein